MAFYPCNHTPCSAHEACVQSSSKSALSSSTRRRYYENDWNVMRDIPIWYFVATSMPKYAVPRRNPQMGSYALSPTAYTSYFSPINSPAVPTVYSYHGRETRRSQIHPLLSAESHRFKAILDLSASQPRLLVPSTRKSFPSTKVNYLPIHPGYLEQPATDPPMKHITITCPSLSPFISDWAINVGHPEASKPVSVGALLRAVQASLQTQIWQAEWSRLSLSRSAEVGEAYTRRCRALESFATAAEFQRNQGVRRVDFLVDRYFFGGVLWTNLDGMDCLKLIVKARST